MASLLTASSGQANELMLVSVDEYRQELATTPPPRTRNGAGSNSVTSGAPVIELLAPKATAAALPSPIDIQLQWQSGADARIDPQSLRISYGWMNLDITQRVIAGAELTADGLRIRKAALPSGEHKLTVEIADSLKRVGRRQFEVKVGGG